MDFSILFIQLECNYLIVFLSELATEHDSVPPDGGMAHISVVVVLAEVCDVVDNLEPCAVLAQVNPHEMSYIQTRIYQNMSAHLPS